ncbi:MAG: C45 family autoproteolytic acyltransferase/hydrolase [Oligoflexia bacterium]|nr:C45 family autoproteolytic acyltransferase/hydrolase [Oligoflexia bacterium]
MILLYYLISSILVSAQNNPNSLCKLQENHKEYKLVTCERLKVFYLYGDPKTRAYTYGKVLKEKNLTSGIDYFSNKIFDSMKNSPIIKTFFSFFINALVRKTQSDTPNEILEELAFFAKGLDRSYIDIKRAHSLPDLGSLIYGISSGGYFKTLPAAGCSSIAKKNADGSFIYGRNLDFAGVNVWDKDPTITIHIPSDNSEAKHLSIGSAGSFLSGITGANEYGIIIAVHQNYNKSRSWSGTMMPAIGELVLRKAKNLEEAKEIVLKNPPITFWTFVITDLKTQETITIEISKDAYAIRTMQSGKIAQSNHLLASNTNMYEYISEGTLYNSIKRKEFLDKQLEKTNLFLTDIQKILSYSENTKGELSAYSDLLKGHTIQSAIFEQKEDSFLSVSIDDAPTSSGDFLRFSLKHLFLENWENAEKIFSPATIEVRENHKEIAQAFYQYFDAHDDSAALKHLSKQTSSDARLFRSVIYLKQKKYADAGTELALRESELLNLPLHIRQSFLYLKILHALNTNQSEKATVLAGELLQLHPKRSSYRKLAEKIQSGLPFSKNTDSLKFEFFSGDLSERPD